MKFRLIKILVSILIIMHGSLRVSNCYASDWVLGSMEFSFKQPKNRTESSTQAAKVLPELILERISSGTIRTIPESESLDRKLKELQKDRLNLFLQLSKESQNRDSLILSVPNEKKLKKKIAEQEKKIAEIQDKISENLEQVQTEIQETQKRIEKQQKKSKTAETRDQSFLPFGLPFFTKTEEDEILQEGVVLYKSDSKSLFAPTEAAKEQGFESYAFEKEVLNAKINGLIVGKITSYGEYCSVNVDLRTYPAGKIIGSVTEVGMLSELIPLANLISQELFSKIANSLPVKIEFDMEPEELFKTATINIDGIVQNFRSGKREVLLDAGVHRIVIEAEGYETLSTAYTFANENVFTVKAKMIPVENNTLNIRLKKYKDGMFYASGVEGSKISDEKPYSTLTINGKTALGVFKASEETFKKVRNKDGEMEEQKESNIAFFRITDDKISDGVYLVANAKPYDRASNIDKRRRWMYTAYTGLICSLPITFYTMGNYNSEVTYLNSINSANNPAAYSKQFDIAKNWELKFNIASGISAAFGAWAIVELIRYLYAADQVLPVEAKIDKNSQKYLRPVIETVEPEVQSSQSLTASDSAAENTESEKNSSETIQIETDEIKVTENNGE